MKKRHKMVVIVFTFLVIGITIGIAVINSYINSLEKQISNITISDVDISKVPNGTHIGSYKIYPVTVIVEVTVNNHKIMKINLVKHENGKGTAAEKIIDKVIESQSLSVDTVSGATVSSKVILKAIEKSLYNSLN